MSIDTVGDFLTVIRNAISVYKKQVVLPFSRLRYDIAKVLKEEGFVKDCRIVKSDNGFDCLEVSLKYVRGESTIHKISRVSKPGRRHYRGVDKLGTVIGGLGVSILTTNKGVMTDHKARRESLGGEVLCMVW
ncbi:30S ribosomal protein S8 [bacterium]|jgi:small subunit ribosomal protein S8|nr:30S ribosomal protein S8 [bacterium]